VEISQQAKQEAEGLKCKERIERIEKRMRKRKYKRKEKREVKK
jgi:hypothetical protein